MKKPVFVTRTKIPDTERYLGYVKDILESYTVTNGGPYSRQFEQALRERLGAFVSVCANGTMSLQIAIRAAGLNGKTVVTTPFTYVATVSALLWEGCTPIFADIDEETLCLSPQSLSELDLSQAAGVAPVHIYGNACDVETIGEIAAANGLVTLYDAAQAFGCLYRDKPLPWYGDFSTLSFHATKIVQSIEGGAIVSHSEEAKRSVDLLRSFGHIGDEHYSLGINAKLGELHAAMGLCSLDDMEADILARRRISLAYDAAFPSRGLRKPALNPHLEYNLPVLPCHFRRRGTSAQGDGRAAQREHPPPPLFLPQLNGTSLRGKNLMPRGRRHRPQGSLPPHIWGAARGSSRDRHGHHSVRNLGFIH